MHVLVRARVLARVRVKHARLIVHHLLSGFASKYNDSGSLANYSTFYVVLRGIIWRH